MPERTATPGLRARACLLLALALLTGGVLGAPSASAESIEGGNSFNELAQKAQEEGTTTEATAATTGTEGEVHNSNSTIFIGVGAAAVLLLGIAFVIVRDARRVAPAGGGDDLDEGRPARDRAVQQRNRRAKARAAKTQRKKNR